MIGLLLDLAARIGAVPAETEDARVRRLIWSTTLICAAPLSGLMAVAFAVLGLRLAAAVWAIGAAFWLADCAALWRAPPRPGLFRPGQSARLRSVRVSRVDQPRRAALLGGPDPHGPHRSVLRPGVSPATPGGLDPRRLPRCPSAASIALSGMVPWAQALPPVVNLVMFGATLTVVAVFVFVTLRYLCPRARQGVGSPPGSAGTHLQASRGVTARVRDRSRVVAIRREGHRCRHRGRRDRHLGTGGRQPGPGVQPGALSALRRGTRCGALHGGLAIHRED